MYCSIPSVRSREASRPRFRLLLGAALAFLVTATGCSSEQPRPNPTPPVGTATAALSALDGDLCLQEVEDLVGSGHGLTCTANDVDVTELVAVDIKDDGCAFPGDTVTLDATFRVALNADHRYDIAIFFSENGESAMVHNAKGGCLAHTLAISESVDLEAGTPDKGSYCSGGFAHACNGDEDCPAGETCVEKTGTDTCGDMTGEVLTVVKDLTLVCADSDVDDMADFIYCSSWRQDGANDLCTTPYATPPGSPSKCNCGSVPTSIPIEHPCDGVVCADQECRINGYCDETRASQGLSGTELCVYEPLTGTACSDDGNACTDDVCAAGVCAHDATDGAVCGEDSECTQDRCVGDTCTTQEIAGACDDGVGCTDDSCQAGACVHEANAGHCDDGVACTVDVCDAATGCGSTPNDDLCEDGVACTDDFCDAATGCGATPNDGACDDGVACTVDVCDPASGCASTPNDSFCDDGVACTDDVCDAVNGCGSAPNNGHCDDGVTCTDDVCDAINGCGSTPNNGHCDDGVACTDDVCDAVNGCGSAPNDGYCDDGVACTDDACDPATGCGSTPNDGYCDDGNACTDDVCGATGCASTDNTASCADDGDACTDDVCEAGSCTHPDNGQCVEPTCETAFAQAETAFCDVDIDGDGLVEKRWGWYGQTSPGTSAEYPLYAGAAHCDPNKGTFVGTLEVTYDGATATFVVTAADGFSFDESHVYASSEPMSTMAPGQFTSVDDQGEPTGSVTHTIDGLSGDIYFSVHAVACGQYGDGGDEGVKE